MVVMLFVPAAARLGATLSGRQMPVLKMVGHNESCLERKKSQKEITFLKKYEYLHYCAENGRAKMKFY